MQALYESGIRTSCPQRGAIHAIEVQAMVMFSLRQNKSMDMAQLAHKAPARCIE